MMQECVHTCMSSRNTVNLPWRDRVSRFYLNFNNSSTRDRFVTRREVTQTCSWSTTKSQAGRNFPVVANQHGHLTEANLPCNVQVVYLSKTVGSLQRYFLDHWLWLTALYFDILVLCLELERFAASMMRRKTSNEFLCHVERKFYGEK